MNRNAALRPDIRTLAFACFFLSGATGLTYEVVWTRLLGNLIGNTHFSITLVVSVFMGGLAILSVVSFLAPILIRFVDRDRDIARLRALREIDGAIVEARTPEAIAGGILTGARRLLRSRGRIIRSGLFAAASIGARPVKTAVGS